MKKQKSNLDERQEQALLRIEHNGCWLAFWGLLAALLIQLIVFGTDFRCTIGEWIVFMILSVYLMGACLKEGIWDRRLKANTRTNVIASAIAALVNGVVMFLRVWLRHRKAPVGSVAAGIASACIVFVLCMIILTLAGIAYRKRLQKMEKEPEE